MCVPRIVVFPDSLCPLGSASLPASFYSCGGWMTPLLAGVVAQVETISGVEEMGQLVEEMTAAVMGGSADQESSGGGTATPMDAE